jgi:hypothetical protein
MDGSFGPDELRLMTRAFDGACSCLEIRRGHCADDESEIARAIIEACREGRREEHQLVDAAIVAARRKPKQSQQS